ncbi:hypothetical protein LQ954_09850 [Sphingomonas sp. IC-11]|uniref:hypothetical protein n=1 Tax=Sphingomonas sp. IC-11 TaxID=2898528 RepID=UPI001E4FFC30|nr:hypothetical protein [Sphingomonas sp. IC-11]MCD2316450.1 hypothetical protein [Sphingomonas sp. IC-11]
MTVVSSSECRALLGIRFFFCQARCVFSLSRPSHIEAALKGCPISRLAALVAVGVAKVIAPG